MFTEGCLIPFGEASVGTTGAVVRNVSLAAAAQTPVDCVNGLMLNWRPKPSLRSVSRYRVLAIDHDMLSFSDLRFEQWPAVLITNPKDAQYLHPGMEPLGRIRRSTHIRLLSCVQLVFSFRIWTRESFKRQNLMTECSYLHDNDHFN